MTDVTAVTDDELAAQIAAAQRTIDAALKEQEARLVASRAKVLAEVQANVRKYKISRTELAPYFLQKRTPKSAAKVTTDATPGKRRGRPKKEPMVDFGTTE